MNGKMSALAAMIYKPAQNSDKELNNNELGQEKEGEKVAENGSEVGNGLCDERLMGENDRKYKIWGVGDKILPMLDGLTTSEIEDVLKYVSDSSKLYPVQIKF